MANKKAIVTLAVGRKFEIMFDSLCRKSWQAYCDVYGYDLIVIKNPLDVTDRARSRSPAWQKLLILSQDWSSAYEQIVWIDTDILINSETSLDISAEVANDRVGAVETYSIPTRLMHDVGLRRQYQAWKMAGVAYIDNLTPGSYYANRGISQGKNLDSVVQTGVLVCSARHHREMFEHVYYGYEDTHGPEWNYEMPALSYELVKADMVHWIPPQFNFCVANLTAALYPFDFNAQDPVDRVIGRVARKLGGARPSRRQVRDLLNIYDLGHFIHFAGCAHLMEPVHSALGKRAL